MGRWSHRPRRYFQRRDRTPRDDDYCDPPEAEDSDPFWGSVDDGVPMWEKKFCSEVGRVPWRKVVDSKMFMNNNSVVINWDDSAGKEAFHKAKDRFWAEINNLPHDVCSPDPNLYIDEIDWNASLDPELLKDVEQSVFVPEEEEMDNRTRRRTKRLRYLLSNQSDGYNSNPGNDSSVLWEHKKSDPQSSVTQKDTAQSWNRWDSNRTSSNKFNKVDNAWVLPSAQSAKGNEWKQSGSQWNCATDRSNTAYPCGKGWQDVDPVKGGGWGKCADGSWNNDWRQSEKTNTSCKSWEKNVRNWQDNKDGNNWGGGQWDNNVKDQGSEKAADVSGGWGAWNNGIPSEKSKQSSSQWHYGKDRSNAANPWGQGWEDVDPANDGHWSNCADGSWDNNWKQSNKTNNSCKPWEKNARGWQDSKEDNSWGGGQWDNSVKDQGSLKASEECGGWGAWNTGIPAEETNNGDSSWDVNAACSLRDDNVNAWDQNPSCNNDKRQKSMESRQVNGSWGEWKDSAWKNRDDGAYRRDYRRTSYNDSTRFQGNGTQTGRSWRDVNTKKRVSFTFEHPW